jgi:hypothetical protein
LETKKDKMAKINKHLDAYDAVLGDFMGMRF